ncbi:MAG TPA: metallophosphoesterase [Gemmatimonadaceae bacterium]|nr:metallophosphoesterase [Gemmatimonadaceae bacterium]
MNRRVFLERGLGAVAASAVGCVGYAIGIEPHWLEMVERDLPVENLPTNLAGARLAHISDIHIGPLVSDDYIVHSLHRVRALQPEIVVFTGDFLTYRAARREAQYAQLRAVLAHLPTGRLATLGILGNHDYGRGWNDPAVAAKVVVEVERAGMRILRNETANVGGLDIVGVDDLWAHRGDPARALAARTGDAAIALVHNPDAADELGWPGFRGWMLAGHTHGGQCKPPFLPPPLLPVRNRRYVSGAVTVDAGRTLYISRGVGHLIRARFLVRPEITLFTLRQASNEH